MRRRFRFISLVVCYRRVSVSIYTRYTRGEMMENPYTSYIFLGLSLAIGIAVYLIIRDAGKKRAERRKKSLLRELEEQYLNDKKSDEDHTSGRV